MAKLKKIAINVLALDWTVVDASDTLVARVAHPEEAAMLVAALGDGTKILFRGCVVWAEGDERQPAGESYDYVADVCHDRATDISAIQRRDADVGTSGCSVIGA